MFLSGQVSRYRALVGCVVFPAVSTQKASYYRFRVTFHADVEVERITEQYGAWVGSEGQAGMGIHLGLQQTWGTSQWCHKGSCGVVQAGIGIFGKNEAMRHFEMVHRIVPNKQGCQCIPKGHLLCSQPEKDRTERRPSGRFLWDRPPKQTLLLLTFYWLELSHMATFTWWEGGNVV